MYNKILSVMKSMVSEEELGIELELAHMETLAGAITEMIEVEFANRQNIILEQIEEIFDR